MDGDPRLYVTRDAQFECYRVVVPTLVIRFHAALDVILRELDAHYVASAWRAANDVLERHGIEPDRFSWGFGQSSELRAADHGHADRPILETVGWVTTERTPHEFDVVPSRRSEGSPPWDGVAAELEACDPPLCLSYDHYEAQVITRRERRPIANDDARTALEIMRVLSTDSPVEWAQFDPSKRTQYMWEITDPLERKIVSQEPADPPDAPWMRLGQAMFERDEAAVADAIDAVRSEYSEHGARICLESALRYLMLRPNGRDV